MTSQQLAVREMTPADAAFRVDYFHDASDEQLATLGVDRALLPARAEWITALAADLALPQRERTGSGLLWLLDGVRVGFSTVNQLRYGSEAHLHLHVTEPTLRHKGLGTEFVRRSVAAYFTALELQRLWCEPHALNVAPNRTLQAAGFRFVSTQHTTPGPINFAQVTNLWVTEPPTVYEAAGGADGMLRLAHAWHERVMADHVVSHAFSHGYHRLHSERLAAYWGEALGGPATYTALVGDETDVVRMHSGNGPHDEMDRRAVACFDQALEDAGLAADERLRAVLHDYFAWATTTTMARYHRSADEVPAGLPLPHWGWNGLVTGAEPAATQNDH